MLNPQICGFKDGIEEDGARYLVILHKTNQFTGKLKSSEKGKEFWVAREEMDSLNLIWNMRELL